MSIFEPLTKYIPKIQDDSLGEWEPKKQGAGTAGDPFQFPYVVFSELVDDLITDLYKFCEGHPEFEHTHYNDNLNTVGIDWSSNSMKLADVSDMDAKIVIALLIGSVRAERFCDGAD